MNIFITYAISWIGLVVVAILNGTLREKIYGRYMGELSAHQLSTLIGLVLFGIYIWFVTGFWRIEAAKQAFIIGCMWLVMTVTFEFLFGHYLMGHPWSRLFHDYNMFRGRIWVLVLIWTAVAPYVFYLLRSWPVGRWNTVKSPRSSFPGTHRG